MDVAIDLDGVLVDIHTPLCRYHNSLHGTNFSKKDLYSYHLEDVWGITLEQAIQEVHDFMFSPYAEDIIPEEGTVEGVNFLLSKGYNLHVVTSRARAFLYKTHSLVNTFFPDKFSSIHLMNHYSIGGEERKKSDVCLSLNAEVLIEDGLEYAIECASKGIMVLLRDCPWNQDESIPKLANFNSWREVPGIARFYFWKEIIERI